MRHDLPTLCPRFHYGIEVLGRRWTGAIVMQLMQSGGARFNELLVAVPGISDRLLAERLRELESEGIAERAVEPGPPVRVSYRLTEAGRALEPALVALGHWAEAWIPLERATADAS